ncbi:MAG TPA: orotate phosphoribosyltransferase [Pyrinomonadaceae bacterium]|nr:orotate phosphoribosyltransferase [Pyrinomonadaceae bacterium]
MRANLIDEALERLKEVMALMLWDMGAIKVNLDKPFRLVSGNYSPIYVNCRQAISAPTFMQLFLGGANIICDRQEIDMQVVAGGETAGIAFAAYLAQGKSLPMIYVRKAGKDYGIASLVEGSLRGGDRVLLVEDLITDGQSKLSFVDSIIAAGGSVVDILVLFDRLQGGAEILKQRGIHLHALTDMTSVLEIAEEVRYLTKNELDSVHHYLESPGDWHSQRSLAFQTLKKGSA